MGMTGMTWRPRGHGGDHGDHRSWGPHGDLLGAMRMTGMTGTMWGPWGQHWVETTGHGDLLGAMGMTGTTWGRWGQ